MNVNHSGKTTILAATQGRGEIARLSGDTAFGSNNRGERFNRVESMLFIQRRLPEFLDLIGV